MVSGLDGMGGNGAGGVKFLDRAGGDLPSPLSCCYALEIVGYHKVTLPRTGAIFWEVHEISFLYRSFTPDAWNIKKVRMLIDQLYTRLNQDRMTESEFTSAVADILAATSEHLSGPDSLLLSQQLRELQQAWQAREKRPVM